MNLLEEIDKIRQEGYSEANAQARLCQDILLYGISKGNLSKNVTIKGGIVLRNLSKNSRRATQDIDLDFIKYSISDASIENFIHNLCLIDGIQIILKKPIQELKHKDYKGKRIFVEIIDSDGNLLESKIDIGVHNDLDIKQESYCFDLCFQDEGVNLLMNSKEQIITEKLKSFLRFSTRSTRYKDVFDIYYLSQYADRNNLKRCIQKYIFDDNTLPIKDMQEMTRRIKIVFQDSEFKNAINHSQKNWTDSTTEEVLHKNIEFISSLE